MPSDSPKRQPSPPSNTKKDPDDWTSGDDPMTGAQASYLKTLSEEAHHRDVRLTPTCPEERRQERQNYHSGGSAEAVFQRCRLIITCRPRERAAMDRALHR